MEAEDGGGDDGIIPACAGSTSSLRRWVTSVWDHPRMRGEHNWPLIWVRSNQGSSPHARGAL